MQAYTVARLPSAERWPPVLEPLTEQDTIMDCAQDLAEDHARQGTAEPAANGARGCSAVHVNSETAPHPGFVILQ